MIEAVENTDLMINPSRRILAAADTMSACLVTGTEKVRSGYGNGDCILADFHHGLFAVADATERFSSASRNFLRRLLELVVEAGMPVNASEVRRCVNEVYSHQEYRQKTTVSCVALGQRDADSMNVFVISGGDSAVTIIDENGGQVYQSKSDMNFAGRSKSAGMVDEVTGLKAGTKIFLYSDGYLDLRKIMSGQIDDGVIPYDLVMKSVDEIAGLLNDMMEKTYTPSEHDDIALIALDPFSASSSDTGLAVLLGGTSPADESRYQLRNIMVNDRFLPALEWDDCEGTLSSAGITVCSL